MTVEDLVWYAAYGSNMSAERLGCYLHGGCPPGGLREHEGARDPSPPRAVRAVRIPYALYFADSSRVWTGGKAFVSSVTNGSSLARAWLLRREQFEDIAGQESGRGPLGCALDQLAPGEHADLGDGPYDRVLSCGEVDGVPMVTFTHPDSPAPRAPSAPYLRILAQGLEEGHGLTTRGCASYLATARGIGATAARLADILGPAF